MPSTRLLASIASAVAACSFAGVAVAQSPMGSESELAVRLGLQFGVVFVLNLLLGGALLGLAPEYTQRMLDELRDDAGAAFLWGLLAGIAVPICLVLLAITIIGLVVTIPGILVLFVVGLVGNAVTICWLGSLIRGRESPDALSVVAGAFVLAVVGAIPVLGNLITTFVGFFGMGVVAEDLYASWR
ncbi:hypothetical protein [Haloplanus sp. C73]|uniref:hypothetical protein n=1 Tax=Haloplanus sp. C73 TaxID=3421641 RepID=UPI003EB6FE1F